MKEIFKMMVAVFAVVTMVSCHPKVITIVKEVPVLRASSIYYDDSIYYFMEKYRDTNKEIAASYYKKGLEQENTNLAKAIYCIKRSITLQPELTRYRELAAMLYKAGMYEEMRELYRPIIEKLNDYGASHFNRQFLFGKPDESLLTEYLTYNLLAFNSNWDESAEDNYTFKDEYGFDLRVLGKKVLSDPRFKFDTNSVQYKDIILSFLSDTEAVLYMKSEGVFSTFLNSIKDTSSVYEINKDSVAEFDYTHFKEMDEPGPQEITMENLNCIYLKECYGKDSSLDYNFKHRFKINDSINAVLYAIDSSEVACPRDMRNIYYRLVTYGKKANIKADMVVACQSGEQLSFFKYNHGAFTVSYFKRYWENPYHKKDFNNHIQKVEQTEAKMFRIKPDGAIEAVLPNG